MCGEGARQLLQEGLVWLRHPAHSQEVRSQVIHNLGLPACAQITEVLGFGEHCPTEIVCTQMTKTKPPARL